MQKNVVLNIIYTLSNIIFPMVTFPYITRILSVHGVGQVYFYQSVANYATMIASLGISTYGIRAVAKVRNDENKLSKVVQELVIINLVMTIIVIALIFIMSLIIPKFRSDYNLLWINCISVVSNVVGMNWLYSGLEQYGYITKRSILFKGISIVLMIIFVHKPGDYIIYALITVFSTTGSNILNLLYSKNLVNFKKSVRYNFKRHFKPMLILFASILAVSVYTNLDTIMLGFIRNSTEVGTFTVAVKIKTLLLSMINAVSAVLLPRLSFYINEGNLKVYTEILKKASSGILTIAIPVSVYFIFFAKESIEFISGKGYDAAILPMQIIMPILIISGFSNVVGNQVLIPNNMERYFMYAVIAGSIMDFLFNIFLMPILGSIGAAIATLIAEFCQMSLQTYFGRRFLKSNIDIKQIIRIMYISVIAIIIDKEIMIVYFNNYNSMFVLVISGIIFITMILIMVFFIKDKIIYPLVKGKILERINK